MTLWYQKTPNDRAVRGVNYEKRGMPTIGAGRSRMSR